SISSENGSRSSTLPPPLAITITSTPGSPSRVDSAAWICGTAIGPCTATLTTRNRATGHRALALLSTSRSAAEARPAISPARRGLHGPQQARGSGYGHRHVRGRVTQGEKRRGVARPGGDLGELALHPHRAQPVDPLGDLAGDGAYRPGVLRRGGAGGGHGRVP